MGFMDSLRMNNIFRPEGGGGNLLGPPDFSGGQMNTGDIIGQIMSAREDAKRLDENRQYRLMNFQNDMNRRNKTMDEKHRMDLLRGSGGSSTGFMNTAVAFPDDDRRNSMRMTDYQRGMLENDKAKNAIAERTLSMRDQNQDADRMIRQQRADTYSNMHDLSDAEKLEIVNRARRGDIEARGMIEAGLLDKRNNAAMDRQNDQQMFQSGMAGVTGQQRLAEIAARVAGDKELAGYKSGLTTANPNFDKTSNWNKAQELINTNPELAPFITLGQGGQFTIAPPGGTNFWGSQVGPTQQQYDSIKNSIYGATPLPNAKPGDAKIETLPAKPNTPITTTPLTTPKANNGSTSKYKVTIK